MRILVADAHQIIRRGLQLIVSRHPGWTIAAEAESAAQLFQILTRDTFDVLVIDLRFRDRNGIDLLEQLRREFQGIRILVLTSQPEEQFAVPALRAGARGFIGKDATADEIIEAIDRVASGRFSISDRITALMAEELKSPSGGAPHERLSVREREVFLRLARGETVTAIAADLGLSVKTVSTYRTRVLEKTGFQSNADLVAYAIRAHLLE